MRMRLIAWLFRQEANIREALVQFLRGVEAKTGRAFMDGRITGIRCNECQKVTRFPFPGITDDMASMIRQWSGWTRQCQKDVCASCGRNERRR